MSEEDVNANPAGDDDLKLGPTEGDPDGDGSDADPDGDDDPGGGSQEDDKPDGGSRAQQRIKALTAKRKEAEEKLAESQKELSELKERFGDAAPDLFIKAAEKTGVLPSLVSKADAKGLTDLADAEAQVRAFRSLLRNNPDSTEFTLGEKEVSRGAVQARLDEWLEKAEDLKEKFGSARKTLQDRAKRVFELGLQAEKAGWKPGQKAAKTDEDPDAGKKEKKGNPPKAPSNPSSERKPPKSRNGGGIDPASVSDAETLANYFEENG